MSVGKFITVEGIEGTGKSTNLDFVKVLIESHGYEVHRTREPGGHLYSGAARIRELLASEGLNCTV